MMYNWMDTLLNYDFSVHHIPGLSNHVADALSRKFDLSLVMNEVDIIPKSERERLEILTKIHNFGHHGIWSNVQAAKSRGFNWKNMKVDVEKVVRSCDSCQKFNSVKRTEIQMKKIISSQPWEHICIDLITPLEMSENGEDTILTIIDVFSRFVILYPLKGKSMREISKHLWKCFGTMGVPKIIQSDNGSEFVNSMIETMKKLCGIEQRTITPYYPQANGIVERANSTVLTALKKELKGKKHAWPKYLDYVQCSYNAKVSKSIGMTPFEAMFW